MPATDMTTKLDELITKMGSVEEALGSFDTPEVHVNRDGRTVAYWGGEEETAVLPALGPGKSLRTMPTKLPKGYKRDKDWGSLGAFLRDGYLAKRDNRAEAWSTKHTAHLEPITKAIQGMSTQVAMDGGALVLPEFNTQIMERVYNNALWQMTDQYSVSGNSLTFTANAETSRANGSRHGGLRGYWTAEGAAGTATKPTMRQFSLKLRKLMIVTYLTEELIQDAGMALEQYISRAVGDEFNFMLGDAVFNGTGAGQPLGIMNAGSLLSITKETGQAAATIVAENIDKMWARRLVAGNYAWFHNQDCGPQLDNLSQSIGTAGVALYRPTNGIAGVAPQMLKTAPRIETEFNATVGTTGDIVLADLGQYVTISKGGIAQAVSVHVEFLTDQTALRFTMRVDGQPWEASPITPYKGSNTQSSFITPETRS